MTIRETRLDLTQLLPDAHGTDDGCAARLVDQLASTEGIRDVHVVAATPTTPAQLCLHHDHDEVSIPRLRELAQRAGTAITDRYGHVVWTVAPIGHVRRAEALAARLEQAPGILEARASTDGVLRVEFDRQAIDEGAVERRADAVGFRFPPSRSPVTETPAAQTPTPADLQRGTAADARDHGAVETHGPGDGHDHAHGSSKIELAAAILAAVLLATGVFLDLALDVASGVTGILFVGAIISAGWFTVQDAWSSVRARRFEIDTLMVVAAAGACALGAFEDAALLLVLFSIGHALEGYAMNRARQAIEALADLAPATARVRADGAERVVPVAELRLGDVIAVRPDERIAADGFVIEGSSSVDQAAVTGESVPVEKAPVDDRARAAQQPGLVPALHKVFAGTINGSGALAVEVTALASESTLARVVQLVTEAETQVSPTQIKTKRFERIFVPATLALVFFLMFAGLVVDEPFSDTFYRAMAVLVAASPCALAIATPSAVLSAVARAGRGGVLVKGGGPLEHLGRISAIAFDKTGTLTEGKPRLVDVVLADGVTSSELLSVAVAVEASSDHPLANAIVVGGRERLGAVTIPDATGVSSITGKGVRAVVDGDEVLIGSAGLFTDDANPPPAAVLDANATLQGRARTTMIVRRGPRYLGVLGVMDQPRPQAAAVVARLRTLGIDRMIMLSGDNQKVAENVASTVGLREARGDLLPEDKVRTINELLETGPVAMVGDGVNDAPALATASVGIAMGAAGSDVALETADVALMGDDLRSLPFVVDLSRRTSRIIRQNLWISLGIVAILVPSTITGIAGIGPAVAIHEGSTLIVVANALRLLAGKRDDGLVGPVE